MAIELFNARMLAPLVAFVERNGARPQSFLDRVRIPSEVVDGGGWVSKRQAYDLADEVVRQSGCRSAVFEAYLGFRFEHLGPLAVAMKPCKTVKEALELGARLASLAYEGNDYFLEIEGETTWFCYREPQLVSPGQTFIKDMTLTVFLQLIRDCAAGDWRPHLIRTQREAINRHRAVEDFRDCASSVHGDSTALAFPTAFLSRRSPWHVAASALTDRDDWHFGPDELEPVVERLYRLLASRYPLRKLPTLNQLAWLVNVSSATLKRQLASVGMTYSRLLDRLRFDRACGLLAMPNVSVNEIAHELGYSGSSNFVRSFRRMTGLTPEGYRRRRSESTEPAK